MKSGTELSGSPLSTSPVFRLRTGLASSIILQIIAAMEGFLLVPLFLRAWGTEVYGDWLTLTALISYLALLNLGGQNFVGNLVAIAYAKGDFAAFQEYLSQGISFFLAFCSIVFGILAIILTIPSLEIINGPAQTDERIILGLLSTSYLVSIVGGMYATSYRATGLYARGAMIGNIFLLLRFVVEVIALILLVQPVLFALVYFIANILNALMQIIDMRSAIPQVRNLKLNLRNALRGRKLLKGSLYFWFIGLSGALNQQGVILVVASNLASTAVTVYSTHRVISGLLRYPLSIFMSPVWAELSILSGQNDLVRTRRLVLGLIKILCLLNMLFMLILFIWVPVIYPWWTHGTVELQSPLLAIFITQMILYSFWTATGWPLLATNQHRNLAFLDLGNAIFSILMASLLTPVIGLVGAAIATLTGDLIFGLLTYPRLAAKHLQLPTIRIYRTFVNVIIAALPLLLAVGVLQYFVKGWVFAIGSSILILILLYPIMLMGFGKEDMAYFLQKFRRSRMFVRIRSI